jgi:hypothetical protein
LTHWGRTVEPFDLAAARTWIAGVLRVGFVASTHKGRMVELLDQAQFDRCGICGKALLHGRGRKKRNLEHVWPKGLGGLDEPGNLLTAHVRCNAEKGDRPPTGCQIIMLIAVCERLDILFRVAAHMRGEEVPGFVQSAQALRPYVLKVSLLAAPPVQEGLATYPAPVKLGLIQQLHHAPLVGGGNEAHPQHAGNPCAGGR